MSRQTSDSPPLTDAVRSPHCTSLLFLFTRHILMRGLCGSPLPLSTLSFTEVSVTALRLVARHLPQVAALPNLSPNSHLPCPAFHVSVYQMFRAFRVLCIPPAGGVWFSLGSVCFCVLVLSMGPRALHMISKCSVHRPVRFQVHMAVLFSLQSSADHFHYCTKRPTHITCHS